MKNLLEITRQRECEGGRLPLFSGLDRVTVDELERIRARMPTPKLFG